MCTYQTASAAWLFYERDKESRGGDVKGAGIYWLRTGDVVGLGLSGIWL
jgi:hypothetical protein